MVRNRLPAGGIRSSPCAQRACLLNAQLSAVSRCRLTGNTTTEHPPIYFEFCTVHVPTPPPSEVFAAPEASRSHLTPRAPLGDGPVGVRGVNARAGDLATWGHSVRMGNWKAVSFADSAYCSVASASFGLRGLDAHHCPLRHQLHCCLVACSPSAARL